MHTKERNNLKKYQNNIIELTIEEAANRFSKTLNQIYPAFGDNAFNERNLTFQFSNVFSSRRNSCAIMEIPFYDNKNKKHNRHLDAYLFDSQIGIFLESKRLVNLPKAKEVSYDLFKMSRDNLSYIVKELHEKNLPKNYFVLVLCESWSESINQWWEDGKCIGGDWDDLEFPYKMCYGKKHIKKWGDCSLTWLYGYRQIKL